VLLSLRRWVVAEFQPICSFADVVDGEVYVAGWGKSGRLGLGTEENHAVPTLLPVPKPHRVVAVFAGGGQSFLLTGTREFGH
jgi:alpha-tubulin suppressor-like RCC1 family protein